jgi:hypothetical protein
MMVWDRDDCSFMAGAAKDRRVFSPRERIDSSDDSLPVTGSSRQFTNVVRVYLLAYREFLSLRRSLRKNVSHP